MKSLVAMVALATLLASPALSQDGVWRGPYRAYANAGGSFVQDYYGYRGYRGSAYRGFDVYDTRGHYLGSDPDPRIRAMLAHDPSPH